MNIDDPKTRVKDDAPSMASVLSKMVELLAEVKASSASPEAKERLLLEGERLMLEQERLKREMPENKQAPGVSVYSNPGGDRDDPKPELQCKTYWVGYEIKTDTITPYELELLNRLQPGTFRVTKSDGTVIPFEVKAKHNDRFQLEELSVWFPCKGDHRQNHGSMVSYLQQALGDHIPTVEELLKELTRLKQEMADAAVGAASV